MTEQFTLKEVCEILGVKHSKMLAKTRINTTSKNRKKFPVFIPRWPATGRGHKDRYSQEDVFELKRYFKAIKIHNDALSRIKKHCQNRTRSSVKTIPKPQ